MTRKQVFILLLTFALMGAVVPAMAQDDEFTFGIVLVGPRNDRGWSQAHYEAGEYVEENVPGSTMLVYESLNPADSPETTLLDVVTEMVDQGAELIITTSDAFEEDTNTVAEAFPAVTFINATGSNVLNGAPENVGNFNGQMEWMKTVGGCAAALATETGQIGYLGPLINAETRRHAASSYLGARYCWENYRGEDPADLDFSVTWIGFWFNIPGVTLDPTEETNAFFDNGADVVVSGIDTTEALVVAGQRAAAGETVYAMPYDFVGACAEAEDVCIGVPYYNWGPAYTNIVNQVKEDTWTSEWIFEAPNFADPDTSIVGFVPGGALTEEQLAMLDEYIAELTAYGTDEANADSIYLWQGPLSLQDGTELAADGEKVELLDVWFLPQLLDGMTGASE
ncbi:MAG: BMP family ABC transporter substrate-binding protein [Burkholderiales bacterium]|nr:BMP family ABC transporter substrate-binding protein [Anaerolineae bacterium]